MNFNRDFANLSGDYLFKEVSDRISEYEFLHPGEKVLKLGIGDVTLPLPRAAVAAIKAAADEMGKAESFRGYLPYEGCGFLRAAVKNYYKSFGAFVAEDEIFISDGAKSDLGNLADLFERGCTALVPDPVYPAYAETNVIAGNKVIYAAADEKNGFLPMPDGRTAADVIYICSPNNPTGAAYTLEGLKEWVDYANANGSVIIYDAAYESFVRGGGLARSVFMVDGAQTCAIEVCSLSKTAGFTGMRCGYTVVPKRLVRNGVRANKLWRRRQSAKFNGVSYVVQKCAGAVLSGAGLKEIRNNTNYYLNNAGVISNALKKLGIAFWGGENSPYIWLKCPGGMSSRRFFDFLLNKAQIAGTPGDGFGKCGEGYFRLTSFCNASVAAEAAERLVNLL